MQVSQKDICRLTSAARRESHGRGLRAPEHNKADDQLPNHAGRDDGGELEQQRLLDGFEHIEIEVCPLRAKTDGGGPSVTVTPPS